MATRFHQIQKISIGHNHFLVSDQDAKRMLRANKSRAPKPGWESLVEVDGKFWFLKQMAYRDRLRWMLFGPTPWRMRDGRLVLDQASSDQNDRDEREVWDVPEKFGIVPETAA